MGVEEVEEEEQEGLLLLRTFESHRSVCKDQSFHTAFKNLRKGPLDLERARLDSSKAVRFTPSLPTTTIAHSRT